MTVALMRAGRPPFAAGDLRAGERDERLAAFESYASSSGRYTFQGDAVVYHVEVRLFPTRVRTDQAHLVDLVGDRLTFDHREHPTAAHRRRTRDGASRVGSGCSSSVMRIAARGRGDP